LILASKTNVSPPFPGLVDPCLFASVPFDKLTRIYSVDDILTLSKLDSQLLLVTPVDAQPLTVAQRALKMHEGELQTADIQLKFVVDDSYKKLGIDWVKFDPSRVLQVLVSTASALRRTWAKNELPDQSHHQRNQIHDD
jgi:hypothetical protein